jgi:hypothetical protein
MWSFIKDGPSFVQFVLLVSCPLLGLSHIVQPQMWIDYFNGLHAKGTSGVITRTFTMELWPALLIVSLHQVWHGVAIVITIYGWLMLTKVAVSLLCPEAGLRSLAMASRGPRGFILAGCVLVAIGGVAGLALFDLLISG